MWIYLVGPFVALLPRRWRRALPFYDAVRWHSASILSGLAESILATTGLLCWYSYSVTNWISRGLDSALKNTGPVEISDHAVGFAALLIFVSHPLTWCIAYFVVEGMVRLCGAFTDSVLGVLPLYLLAWIYSKSFRIEEQLPPGTPKFAQGHVASYLGTMREEISSRRLSALPDELHFSTEDSDEILEIRASHRKPDWDPPRTVRYEDRYYRLEERLRGSVTRPFLYRLRRLSKGVPSRTVVIYAPAETPVIASR
jgi:hypothetical protein